MPTVPRVTGPTVQRQIVQQPKASEAPAGAFGLAGLGKAVESVTNSFVAAQQAVDESVAEDALIRFERDKNDLLFNPETGYLNSVGKNAMDGAKTTQDQLQKIQQQYIAEFKSENARRAFSRTSGVHMNRTGQTIMQHASKGARVFDLANQAAAQENAIEGGALYWADDESRMIHRAQGEEAVLREAELQGLPVAEKLQTFRSSFELTSIGAAVEAGDVDRAKALLASAENSKRLEGPDLIKANKLIQNETDKQVVRSHVERIHSDTTMTRQEKLNAARDIDDVDHAKEVERQVGLRITADEKAFKVQQGETFQNHWKTINAGTINPKTGRPYSVNELLSVEDRDLLDVAHIKALDAAEEARVKGTTIPRDPSTVQDFKMMPVNEMLSINVDADPRYAGKAGADRAAMKEFQAKTRNGQGADDKQVATAVEAQLLKLSGGRFTTTGSKTTAQQNKAFKSAYIELVNDEIERLKESKPSGYRPSAAEVDAIIQRTSGEVVYEDYYVIADKDISLVDIPKKNRSHITSIGRSIRARGGIVTTEAIVNAYNQLVEQGAIDE